MEAKIIKIGNSRGVRLPKTMLDQAGISDRVDLSINGNTIVVGALTPHPRANWESSFGDGGKTLDAEDLEWLDTPSDGETSEW